MPAASSQRRRSLGSEPHDARARIDVDGLVEIVIVRIVADDLTGALDTAAPFAAASGPLPVFWDRDDAKRQLRARYRDPRTEFGRSHLGPPSARCGAGLQEDRLPSARKHRLRDSGLPRDPPVPQRDHRTGLPGARARDPGGPAILAARAGPSMGAGARRSSGPAANAAFLSVTLARRTGSRAAAFLCAMPRTMEIWARSSRPAAGWQSRSCGAAAQVSLAR